MDYITLTDKFSLDDEELTEHQTKWIENYNNLVSVLETRFTKKKKITSKQHKKLMPTLFYNPEIEHLKNLIEFFDMYYDKISLCFDRKTAFDSNEVFKLTSTYGGFKDFTQDRRSYNYQQRKLENEIKVIITTITGSVTASMVYDKILDMFPKKTYDDDELDLLLNLFHFAKTVRNFDLSHRKHPNRNKKVMCIDYCALYDELKSNPSLSCKSRYFIEEFVDLYKQYKKGTFYSVFIYGYDSTFFTVNDETYVENKQSGVSIKDFYQTLDIMKQLQKKSFA